MGTRSVSFLLQRAALRGLSVVAPSAVDRFVFDRFCTPARVPVRGSASLPEPWFVQSGGERLAVYSQPAGPRVLFVHGWESRALDFAPLAAEFRAAGYGIVTFDQPAHGRSSGKRTTLPHMAQAVLDVGRATGPFAAVVSHSLGAAATMLALRDGLDARAAAMIAPPRDARPFIALLAQHLGLSPARVAAVVALLEREVGNAVGGDIADRAAAQLRMPGLVLHDRDDRRVPFAHGAALAAAWPGARFVPLHGLGHRRPLDAPEIHREILAFIDASTFESRQHRLAAS